MFPDEAARRASLVQNQNMTEASSEYNKILASYSVLSNKDYQPLDTGVVKVRKKQKRAFKCGGCMIIFGMIMGYYLMPQVINGMQSKIYVTRDIDCFNVPTDVCHPLTMEFYLWNITNPYEFMMGEAPPDLQQLGPYGFEPTVHNVETIFYDDDEKVQTTMASYIEYDPSRSCAECSKDDLVTTVNVAYLKVLGLSGGSETVLLLSFVSDTVVQLVEGMGQVVQLMAMDPTAAPLFAHIPPEVLADAGALGALQWANCGALGTSISDYLALLPPEVAASFPAVPEYCGWAARVADPALGVMETAPVLPVELATALYTLMKTGDPTMTMVLPVLEPQMLQALLGGPEAVSLEAVMGLQQYFVHVAFQFVMPVVQMMQGPPLGPNSGGLLVQRTVWEHLTGYYDPLVSSTIPEGAHPLDFRIGIVSHVGTWDKEAFALLNYSRDADYVRGDNGKRLFTTSTMFTGRDNVKKTAQVISWTNQTEIPVGEGRVSLVAGTQGMVFPAGVPKAKQLLWDDTTLRSIPLTYTGESRLKLLDTYVFEFGWNAMSTCEGGNEERCVFPDNLYGAFNNSWEHLTPSMFTKPHFQDADLHFLNSLGNATAESIRRQQQDHAGDTRFEVEPFTGMVVKSQLSWQGNYLVTPTEVFYPNLWSNKEEGHPGVWMPSFWFTRHTELADTDAYALSVALKVVFALQWTFAFWFPVIGGALVAYTSYLLFCSRNGRRAVSTYNHNRKLKKLSVESRSSSLVIVDHDPEAAEPLSEGSPDTERRPSVKHVRRASIKTLRRASSRKSGIVAKDESPFPDPKRKPSIMHQIASRAKSMVEFGNDKVDPGMPKKRGKSVGIVPSAPATAEVFVTPASPSSAKAALLEGGAPVYESAHGSAPVLQSCIHTPKVNLHGMVGDNEDSEASHDSLHHSMSILGNVHDESNDSDGVSSTPVGPQMFPPVLPVTVLTEGSSSRPTNRCPVVGHKPQPVTADHHLEGVAAVAMPVIMPVHPTDNPLVGQQSMEKENAKLEGGGRSLDRDGTYDTKEVSVNDAMGSGRSDARPSHYPMIRHSTPEIEQVEDAKCTSPMPAVA